MPKKYSIARLRGFVDDRDEARAALDLAAVRLKDAKARLATAERTLREFKDSAVNFSAGRISGDEGKKELDRQISGHERRAASLTEDVATATELVAAAQHNRDIAAEKLNVAAALAASCIEFSISAGFCPVDVKERA